MSRIILPVVVALGLAAGLLPAAKPGRPPGEEAAGQHVRQSKARPQKPITISVKPITKSAKPLRLTKPPRGKKGKSVR